MAAKAVDSSKELTLEPFKYVRDFNSLGKSTQSDILSLIFMLEDSLKANQALQQTLQHIQAKHLADKQAVIQAFQQSLQQAEAKIAKLQPKVEEKGDGGHAAPIRSSALPSEEEENRHALEADALGWVSSDEGDDGDAKHAPPLSPLSDVSQIADESFEQPNDSEEGALATKASSNIAPQLLHIL